MEPLTLYFDRNIGTRIPEALRLLGMRNVLHHHIHRGKVGETLPIGRGQTSLFKQDEKDDVWLDFVGQRKWIVFGQDYKWHNEPAVLAAIKQHSIGCFYLPGAQATSWSTLRVFARSYDRILQVSKNAPRPFIYRVSDAGRLSPIALP